MEREWEEETLVRTEKKILSGEIKTCSLKEFKERQNERRKYLREKSHDSHVETVCLLSKKCPV